MDFTKPNPFKVLGLSVDASYGDIVARKKELDIMAESEEQQLLFKWATEQLITNKLTRLQYELFEVPQARYRDDAWERFTRIHRRNPVDVTAITEGISPPGKDDFDLAALVDLVLRGMLAIPDTDMREAIENAPFRPGRGLPPLEVRDVIFG